MKYTYISLLLLIFASSIIPAVGQTSSENYVLSRTYRVKGASVMGGNNNYWGNADQVQTQIGYIDGLGKTSQTVLISGNPSYKDLISRVEYNNVYRPAKEFLPVAVSSSDGRYVGSASGAYYNSGTSVPVRTISGLKIFMTILPWEELQSKKHLAYLPVSEGHTEPTTAGRMAISNGTRLI